MVAFVSNVGSGGLRGPATSCVHAHAHANHAWNEPPRSRELCASVTHFHTLGDGLIPRLIESRFRLDQSTCRTNRATEISAAAGWVARDALEYRKLAEFRYCRRVVLEYAQRVKFLRCSPWLGMSSREWRRSRCETISQEFRRNVELRHRRRARASWIVTHCSRAHARACMDM